MKLGWIVAGCLGISACISGGAEAQRRDRFYDERGRLTGTAEHRGDGRIMTYDERGRSTGRLERRPDGWRQYDERGRVRGRIERGAQERRR